MTPDLRFDAIVGHAAVIARLRAAASSGRLGSAYLLFGEPGIGKRTLAHVWARLIQCEHPKGGSPASEPCGECRSCRQQLAETHPDFSVLEPDGTTVITIDQVRRLQETLPYRPITSARRVVLIPEADRLNPEGANALLKILEEPPRHVVFILVTAQRDRLLPTVLSRCQAIRCIAPPPDAVINHLTDALQVPADEARRVFAEAQGRVGPAIDAVRTGQSGAHSFDDVGAPETISATARVLDVAERVGKDQEALRALLAWLTLWLRDVLAWQATRDPARLLHRHRTTEVQWWAQRLTMDDVMAAAAGVHAVWTAANRNLNPQLVAEVVLLNLSQRAGSSP